MHDPGAAAAEPGEEERDGRGEGGAGHGVWKARERPVPDVGAASPQRKTFCRLPEVPREAMPRAFMVTGHGQLGLPELRPAAVMRARRQDGESLPRRG